MVILVAIGSAFFTAVINVYLKKIFSGASTRQLAPLNFALSSAIMLLFSPVYFYFKYSLHAVIYLSVIFIADTIANYFYYTAIETNQVSYSSIFMSLSPIFTLLIFTTFIGTISLTTLISILGIMISIYILNLDHKTTIFEPILYIFKGRNYLGIAYAVFSSITAIFAKHVFSEGYINPPTLYLLRDIFIFISLSLALKPKLSHYNEKIAASMFIRALFGIASMLLYFYAISLGHVVLVTVVSNIYPAFILIFSYFIFKEKFSYQKILAVLTILFFIGILSYNFK